MKKLVLIAIIFLNFAACGRKGALMPPEALVPAAVQDLNVRQQGGEFRVAWSAPTKEQGGRPLRDLTGFRLFRRSIAGDGNDCSSCPDSWKLLTNFDLDLPGSNRQTGVTYSYLDRSVQSGSIHQYRLIAVSRSGGISAPVTSSLKKLHPVIAPPSLKGTVLPASVRLDFTFPATEKMKLVGFNLYRRSDEKDPSLALLNSVPISQSFWEDPQVEFGRTYRYEATALLELEGEIVESLPSDDVDLLFTLQELR